VIKTLSKVFAQCHPRHSLFIKDFDDKQLFAEYFLSGTRQRFYRVSSQLSAKKKTRYGDGVKMVTAALPSVLMEKQSAKTHCLPSARSGALGKGRIVF